MCIRDRIKTNINDFLDKIETEDTPKDYLSVEELYKLAETPVSYTHLNLIMRFAGTKS